MLCSNSFTQEYLKELNMHIIFDLLLFESMIFLQKIDVGDWRYMRDFLQMIHI